MHEDQVSLTSGCSLAIEKYSLMLGHLLFLPGAAAAAIARMLSRTRSGVPHSFCSWDQTVHAHAHTCEGPS